MKPSRIPLLTTIFVLLFFYVPLLLMVVQSFQCRVPGMDARQWTLKWYDQIFHDPRVLEVSLNTLVIGLSAAVLSTILGTLAALAIYRYRSRLQSFHAGLLYVPLVLPEILMGISLLVCFSALGIELGRGTVIAAHVAFCTSYVAIVIMTSLQGFDYTLVEAARDLGATSWQTNGRIVLPLLFPAIAAGALLAFTLSLDDFIVTFFVSGKGCTTLPVYIYSAIKHGRPERMCAISSALLGVTFILVTVSVLCMGNKVVEGKG
ncbi:MAG: ABC transporter permease [Planctomycetia bacterium]|nr:ABC transporter permease [Planctomycetia bacterium]